MAHNVLRLGEVRDYQHQSRLELLILNFAQMNDKEQITALRQTAVVRSASTPLERCWALRNYIGTLTGRYDVADEIGVMVCDLMIPYQPKDKMLDKTDDDCTEYWEQTKNYLLGGR